MPIPTSGPITFTELKNEFNDVDPVFLRDFYRGGGLVPDSPVNSNVPTSGQISVSEMRGASNELVAIVSSNTTQLNISTLFSPSDWSSSIPKRVQINSGVVIGSTSTGTPALTVGGGAGGVVRLDNAGSIRGAGGSANSGNGGPALRANNAVEIQNTGEIYAGGGGGGRGGTGGSGSCSPTPGSPTPCPCGPGQLGCVGGACPCGGNFILCCCNAVAGLPQCRIICCRAPGCTNPPSGNPNVSGGAGGAGGRGRGYTQSAQGGSTGSLGPDCNGPSGRTGGRGGTGGTGGDWGTNGDTGNAGNNGNLGSGSAGIAGGTRGAYIINDSNVTWIGPRGTVAGRVA